MIHVVDFEKTAFSTSFRGVLPPSGPQISAEGGMGYPLLGARETWVVSTVHRPLFSRPTPHASRLSSGVRSCAGPSPLATDTNRRFVKERTGPDRDEQPLCIEYDTEPDDPFGQIKIFLPARRRSTVDRSLAAGGAQRQWVRACLLSALDRSPCPLSPVSHGPVGRTVGFCWLAEPLRRLNGCCDA